MKTKILFLAILAAFSVTSFGQVKITYEIVKYERKGADVPEYKKTFEINYPRFSGVESTETLKRLERTFSYWNVFDTSLEEETDNYWLEFMGYQVLYNKNDIVVIQMYSSGVGAYPDQATRTIVADINSGNQIMMKEVFKNRIGLLTELDKRQQAEMAAEIKRFAEEKIEDSDGIFEDVRKASDEVEEFTVSDSGVTFLFDYGFPHVIQALQPEGKYFFSWAEIKPYLREYSSIDMIAKKAEAPGKTFAIFDLRLGGLLGGIKNGDTIEPMAAAKQLSGESPYVVLAPGVNGLGLTIDKYQANHKGKIADEQTYEICPEYRGISISPDVTKGLAFSGDATWDPVPHPVTKISSANTTYAGVVADFLKTKGLPNSKVKIDEIYKVDLEGDGTDEVVISATNYVQKEFMVEKGGYSFVLVRKVINGKPVDLLLGGDFITEEEEASAESTYEVSGIVDLDGDGKMEIVVYSGYYEGASSAAFKIENGVAKTVLETGCGL